MTIAVVVSVAALVAFIAALVGGFLAARSIFRVLPAPTSFAEGQRLVYGWLAGAAGMFCSVMAICLIALLVWGGWSKAEEHTIVLTLGCTLGGYIAAMAAVMIGLLVGGPVGRFKADVSKTGVNFEADSNSEAPIAVAAAAVVPNQSS